MKIARIFAHRVELPLVEGSYKWSGGKSVSVFDSTIVGVETDCGLVGYGEVCPLGPFYLPAYAEGVRAGLRELGPQLIGFDPRELMKLNHRMDAALKGHPYVKSGIDIACWGILGQTTGSIDGACSRSIKVFECGPAAGIRFKGSGETAKPRSGAAGARCFLSDSGGTASTNTIHYRGFCHSCNVDVTGSSLAQFHWIIRGIWKSEYVECRGCWLRCCKG